VPATARAAACTLLLTLLACGEAGSPPAQPEEDRPVVAGDPTPTVTVTGTPSPSCDPPCRRRPRVVGRFDPDLAPEASGLAASRRNPGLLYLVDDGPGTTSVAVLDAGDVSLVAEITVEGMVGQDTEDLAVGPCRAGARRTCVFVGDIGDNLRARETITVTRFVEPDLSRPPPASVAAQVATLRYPDGPHDAETLLVDDDGAVGVVTKDPGEDGLGAARLYVTPRFGDATLTDAGAIRLPPPMAPTASAVVGHVATGGDLRKGRAVIRTYDALYELTGRGGLSRLPSWSIRQIPAPAEPQGEAVAYAADGCGLFTVSERSTALTAMPCRRP